MLAYGADAYAACFASFSVSLLLIEAEVDDIPCLGGQFIDAFIDDIECILSSQPLVIVDFPVGDLQFMLDVFLLTIFGTALSSCINFPLSTNGQASAVGTIVSSGYGFICGAYMPLSNFSGGLQKVISFLPGTYGTSLLRNHALRGVYAEMADIGFPPEIVESIKDSIDCNIYFFGTKVGQGTMYIILTCSIVVFVGIYILMNVLSKAKKHK